MEGWNESMNEWQAYPRPEGLHYHVDKEEPHGAGETNGLSYTEAKT